MNSKKYDKSKISYPLRALTTAHIQFQEALDIITASTNNVHFIDALVEVRRFNLSCINRYNAMLSKTPISFSAPKNHPFSYLYESSDDEALFSINNHLAALIPLYTQVLMSPKVDAFAKSILAQNHEKLVFFKDELLPPVTLEFA